MLVTDLKNVKGIEYVQVKMMDLLRALIAQGRVNMFDYSLWNKIIKNIFTNIFDRNI